MRSILWLRSKAYMTPGATVTSSNGEIGDQVTSHTVFAVDGAPVQSVNRG